MPDRFDRSTVQDPRDDVPVGELVKQASEQTARLVRQEMRLAQLELTEKAKHAGIGVGMFGAAGVVALYGVGALIATAIMALATAVDPWLAGLIVAGALLAVAGVMALGGKKQVDEATPPAPEQAIDSVQSDIDEVKTRSGRA